MAAESASLLASPCDELKETDPESVWRTKDVKSWTDEEVERWLCSIGFEEEAALFPKLIDANNEETTSRDNLNLLYIPEDCVVTDMEKLYDNNHVMLHSVQNILDASETLHRKNWRGVGMALGVSSEDLDLIETFCTPQESPTEALVSRLITRSCGEPSMREFVKFDS